MTCGCPGCALTGSLRRRHPDPERTGNELRHHEINDRWQELDIVLDGREQRTGYAPDVASPRRCPPSRLLEHLRYAAGVELAVMLEYLAAAYSLNTAAGAERIRSCADDIAVARYEILRVAQSEMRHLKAVNGLLLEEHQARGIDEAFRPALGIGDRACLHPTANMCHRRTSAP